MARSSSSLPVLCNRRQAINREELAWAAGLFDGEGTFYCGLNAQSRGYKIPCLTVKLSNTCYPVVQRFQTAIMGLGHLYNRNMPKVHWKPQLIFSTGKFEHAQAIIAMLWPFLSEAKRKQARAALTKYHQHD
jgi:hypothetical protein